MNLAMKTSALLLSLVILSGCLYAQQIAETNLVIFEPNVLETDPDVKFDNCPLVQDEHGDGVVLSAGKKPKLRLSLALFDEPVARGDSIEGQVSLENVGSDDVTIPWSSDPHTRNRPIRASRHEYQMGWFEFELKGPDKGTSSVTLESRSSDLYGATSNADSFLRIKPGQWVTARIRLVLEEERTRSMSMPIHPGKAEITAAWRQASFTWEKDGCSVKTGYFSYQYQEQMKPVRISIEK